MASRLRRGSSSPISFFAFLDIITAVTGILILITLILSTDFGGYGPAVPDQAGEDERLTRLLKDQSLLEVENARLRRLTDSAGHAPAVGQLQSDVAVLRRELAGLENSLAGVAVRKLARLSEQRQQSASLGIDQLRDQLREQEALVARAGLTNDQLQSLLLQLGARLSSVSNQIAKVGELRGQTWLRPDDAVGGKRPRVILVSGQGAAYTPLDQSEEPQYWSAGSSPSAFSSFCGEQNPVTEYIVFLIRPSGVELFDKLQNVAREHGLAVGYDAIAEDLVVHVGTIPSMLPENRGRGGGGDRSGGTSVGGSDGGDGNDSRGRAGAGSGKTSGSRADPGAGETGNGGDGREEMDSPKSGKLTGSDSTGASNSPVLAPEPDNSSPAMIPVKSRSWWERFVEFVQGLFGGKST